MIVVSDTSPITNLIQIGKLGLLQKIYTTVFIPPEVYKELSFLDFQKNILEAQNWIIKKELFIIRS